MAFVRLIDYTMELGLRPCAFPFIPRPRNRSEQRPIAIGPELSDPSIFHGEEGDRTAWV